MSSLKTVATEADALFNSRQSQMPSGVETLTRGLDLDSTPTLHVAITFFDSSSSKHRSSRLKPDQPLAKEVYQRVRFRKPAKLRSKLDRWGQLASVLKGLCAIDWMRLEITVFSNALPERFEGIEAMLLCFPQAQFRVAHVDDGTLDHPYKLAWSHRQVLPQIVAAMGEKDMYLYLEDDEAFSAHNLKYFNSMLKLTSTRGLIPSFMRVEFHETGRYWVSSDLVTSAIDARSPSFEIPDLNITFIELPNPYCGLFLLDQALAVEFTDSPVFAEATNNFRDWGIRERAASGLLYHNPPEGFQARGVVAFYTDSGLPVGGALVHHLGNVYANDETMGYGNFRVDRDMLYLLSQPNVR